MKVGDLVCDKKTKEYLGILVGIGRVPFLYYNVAYEKEIHEYHKGEISKCKYLNKRGKKCN